MHADIVNRKRRYKAVLGRCPRQRKTRYQTQAAICCDLPPRPQLAYYAARGDGPKTLLVRTLPTGEIRPVQSSASAAMQGNSLFWSPDGRQLVRGTASGADVFDVTTGTARPLCDCRYVGGSWNRDGVILLGTLGSGGIQRLSLGDRTPVAITNVDASRSAR